MKNLKKNKNIKNRLAAFILIAVLAAAAAFYGIFDASKTQLASAKADGVAYIHYIDVGQGDASLISLPDGSQILIDTGPQSEAGTLTKYLARAGANTIDYLILTHPHEDHIGGAPRVFEACEVERVIMPDAITDTRIFNSTLEAIEQEGCQNILAEPGQTYTVSESAAFQIYGPIQTEGMNLNDCSIVLRFEYGDTSFVFTGDAEAKSEKLLLNAFEPNDFSCDVYQAGHHGSNTSSCNAFLDAMNPLFAVISCGKDNDYGHPHSEVLRRFSDRNIICYRTDEMGHIILRSDGNTVSLYSNG